MGRRNRRRDDGARPLPGGMFRERINDPDGDWVVQRVSGASASKAYTCPGCHSVISPGTPHVVAWQERWHSGVDDRRHWHSSCWDRRDVQYR